MQLCDDLPTHFLGARILTYGYDTKLQDSQSMQDLEAVARTFRTSLKTVKSKAVMNVVFLFLFSAQEKITGRESKQANPVHSHIALVALC